MRTRLPCYICDMPLEPADVIRLERWTREVGQRISWDLEFVSNLGNPEIVAVSAAVDLGPDGPRHIVVLGPGSPADVVHDLEALERGDKVLWIDEDGDPLLR